MAQALVVREVPTDGRPTRVAALEEVEESFVGDGRTVVEVGYSGMK